MDKREPTPFEIYDILYTDAIICSDALELPLGLCWRFFAIILNKHTNKTTVKVPMTEDELREVYLFLAKKGRK